MISEVTILDILREFKSNYIYHVYSQLYHYSAGPGARGRIQVHTRLEPDSTIEWTTQSAYREPDEISDVEQRNSRNHSMLHCRAMIKKF